jgi:hypothetical protein
MGHLALDVIGERAAREKASGLPIKVPLPRVQKGVEDAAEQADLRDGRVIGQGLMSDDSAEVFVMSRITHVDLHGRLCFKRFSTFIVPRVEHAPIRENVRSGAQGVGQTEKGSATAVRTPRDCGR